MCEYLKVAITQNNLKSVTLIIFLKFSDDKQTLVHKSRLVLLNLVSVCPSINMYREYTCTCEFHTDNIAQDKF